MTAEETYSRVKSGQEWLSIHDSDPPGRFYMWHKAGVRKVSFKKGAAPEKVAELQAAYDKWCKALKMWVDLYHRLENEVEAEYPESAWKVN